MKLSKRILSTVISMVMTGAAIAASVVPSAYAEDTVSAVTSDINDTINQEESKVEETTEAPFNVFDIYDAHQKVVPPKTTTPVQQPVVEKPKPSIYKNSEGIDVSYAQGKINWKAVKASGIDYAIIRAGYGNAKAYPNQVDTWFEYNIKEAQAAGIKCGAYWFSYATDVNGAYAEAESCYEVIKKYKFDYPIYFDIETEKQMNLSATQVSAIIEAFCSRLQSKGYYVGLYSYASMLQTKVIETTLKKYDVWVAHVNVSKPAFSGNYGMWQYSWTGRINGISTDVDKNHCYINYPYIISPDTYTDTGKETTYTPPAGGKPLLPGSSQGVATGIDVSEWQKDINWKSVKASGVDFAIIRAGYGKYSSQKDPYFEKNMKAAKAAGINCGAYWYSYATTTQEAYSEAALFYKTIQGYKFEYPLYVVFESGELTKLSREQMTEIAKTFCTYFEKNGYYIGIKSFNNLFANKFDTSIFSKYDVWATDIDIAAPQYCKTYGLWQYTATGFINGISTLVNMDRAYQDFPTIMKEAHLNGY